MAIRIIEGAIGSGKTYYAVQHLLKKHFTWDRRIEEWKQAKGVEVYTNIDGFKLGQPLERAVEEAGGPDKFFTVEYQKKLVSDDKRAVYVIDEAQRLFDRKFYNKDVFYFFQYSRHLGIDVYFVTQDVSTLARELQHLAEYHIEVQRRSLSFTGEFKYRYKAGGESFKTQTMKPDRRIFYLYRSMTKGESEKIPSATRRWAVIFVALIVFSGLVFYFGFIKMFMPRKAVTQGEEAGVIVVKESDRPARESGTGKDMFFKNGEINLSASSSRLETYQIVAMIKDHSTGMGYILYKREKAQGVYRLTSYEFDRLCRCNSLSKLRGGDYIDLLVKR